MKDLKALRWYRVTEPDAWLVKRVKNPGLDLERTVKDVVRIKDKDTTLEGIEDSVSYEPTEPLFAGSTIQEAIQQRIEEIKKHEDLPDREGVRVLKELKEEFKQKKGEKAGMNDSSNQEKFARIVRNNASAIKNHMNLEDSTEKNGESQ